jgi:ABC-type spermidine/putrescine transport system permease subunit II
MIRRGVTPEVNALATLLLLFSLVTISVAVVVLRPPEIERGSQ